MKPKPCSVQERSQITSRLGLRVADDRGVLQLVQHGGPAICANYCAVGNTPNRLYPRHRRWSARASGPHPPDICLRCAPADASLVATPPTPQPPHRLDQGVLDQAVAAYAKYHCSYGRTSGPALIVVVDFAKKSNEPRLYRIDLRNGQGIDDPIRVAHGIGSDPDDDGFASVFSNVYNSIRIF